MNDSELSLAVAKIMRPEYEWFINPLDKVVGTNGIGNKIIERFDHTTDDALGKTCVWLANYLPSDETYDPVIRSQWILTYLMSDNPHRAIAEAIVEIGGKDD